MLLAQKQCRSPVKSQQRLCICRLRLSYSPNNPELVLQVLNTRQSRLYYSIVAYPVRGHSQARWRLAEWVSHIQNQLSVCHIPSAFRSYFQCIDLSRIEPRDSQHSHAETGKESKEECHCNRAQNVRITPMLTETSSDGNAKPARCASSSRTHHDLPPAKSLDDKVG